MKQLRILFVSILVIFSTLMYGQKDSLILSHISLIDINFDTTVLDLNTSYGDMNFFKKGTTFSEYNPVTKLNDSYVVVDDNYVSRSSNVVPENNTRGHKIDSSNPYGAPNVQSAIGLGLINGLLKKIQN